jgi:polyisoprenoid-binding protein YceI
VTRWVALALMLAGCAGGAPRAEIVRAPTTRPEPQRPLHYCVDREHSRLIVVARAMGGRYPVRVKRWSGTVTFDQDRNAAAQLVVEADLESAEAGSELLTDLVRSPRILNVERWPRTKFVSRAIEHETAQSARVVGILSLHGKERTLAIPVRFDAGRKRLRAEARFVIDRTDFDIRPGGLLGWALADDLEVQIHGVARSCARPAQLR